MSLPFALPGNLPVPRRVVLLGVSVLSFIVLFYLLTPTESLPSAPSTDFSPSKWLPSIPSPFGTDYPDEWDEDGQCLFLSPFDALSEEEKERANQLVLEAVSTGIVKSSNVTHSAFADTLDDEELDYGSMGTKPQKQHGGLTNPILGLLRDGERKWQDLVARQSKTLEQAVDEYRARWNREPPKGFGEWWQFAQSRNVLLPDEYDPIMTALLPYYALPVDVLQERMKEAESVAETFTLIVHDGKVELQWNDDYSRDTWWASRPRADAQINLMEPFIDRIGSFRATFTIHDQPTIMLEYERMKELTDLAKQHKLTGNPTEEDKPVNDYVKACAPDSPLAKGEKEPAATDTFVSSHLAAMDPCHHPSLMSTHGITLEVKNGDSHPKPHTRLLPILVLSKTTLHADIPITPVGKDGRRDDVGPDPLWSKKSDLLYWRGLATGLEHNTRTGSRWRESHRSRLHLLANDQSTTRQEVLVPLGSSGEAEIKDYSLRDLGKYYMDVKLAGGPWQCDGNDGTCDEMKELFHFADKDNAEKSNNYKYVFDTDGNAWSSRFPRLMASKNMVIKASIFPEWNTQSLPEWYAYVPSKMDYSDLYSIMAFFRGVPGAKGRHDEVARRIASNGQCWVERTWRREDMQAYMYRLYLEYARLMSTDRDNGKMDFGFPPNPPKPAEPAIPDVNA